MRQEVCIAWREQIESAVAEEFPQFQRVTSRTRGEPRHLLKYRWHPHQKLWCFIAFRPLDSEAFDAFVGWSSSDRFPISDGATGAQDPEDFEAPHMLFWSSELVPRSGTAHWSFWNPPQSLIDDPAAFATAYAREFTKTLSPVEAADLVRPAVKAGIAEVREFGIPYLERRAKYEASKR